MAAAMSTADGLVLAISNALSHDIYYKIINPKAETAKRLIVARVLLVIIGFAGATIAALEIQGILGSVIWAFDFAMSGLVVRSNIWNCLSSLGKKWWSWLLGSYTINFRYSRITSKLSFNDCSKLNN